MKPSAINEYNIALDPEDQKIAHILQEKITAQLTSAESRIWHAHPVWFINGNPIVGYSKQKAGMRLLFWSGNSFDEPNLKSGTGKFKDASIFFNKTEEINLEELIRWLKKSETIQWDYKNLVKRKGELIRL